MFNDASIIAVPRTAVFTMKKTIIAAVAILVLCSTIGIADVEGVGQPASATATGLGEFNIYFQIDGSYSDATSAPTDFIGEWAGYYAQATDGYLALIDVLTDLNLLSNMTVDGSFYLTTPYTTNNTDYGTITKLFGLENSTESSWNVYVYKNGSWSEGIDAIGLYQPFSDYVEEYRVSNIALYYGATGSLESMDFDGLSIIPLTQVPASASDAHASDYQVDFTFVRTVDGQTVTTTAVGYGSNGFEALKNAVGTDAITGVIGSSDYGTYGWLTKLFGIGTVQISGQETPDDWTDDVYTYWALYYDDPATAEVDWKYADFTSAFYGTLDGSAVHADSFRFVYQ